jgi:dethiobiotin synthetase
MHRGYFITGTDTGVGKTIVTAALAAILRKLGFKVGVMKPIETGCRMENGHFLPQDALFLRAAAESSAPLDLINPYAFAEPIAPAIAADLAGVTIDIDYIHQCYLRLLAEHEIVLVEGAGGLLVPVNSQSTMHDIAVALDLPLFIVARNVLGVINHTALTVHVSQKRSPVVGVILNQIEPPEAADPSTVLNKHALIRWVKAPVYSLPYIAELNPEALRSLGDFLLTDRLLEDMDITASPLKSPAYEVLSGRHEYGGKE